MLSHDYVLHHFYTYKVFMSMPDITPLALAVSKRMKRLRTKEMKGQKTVMSSGKANKYSIFIELVEVCGI